MLASAVCGEVNFDKAYDGNILVNAMTVGVAKTDKIFYSAAAGIGYRLMCRFHPAK